MNDSGILKTSEQRILVLEDLISRYPNMKNLKKLQSVKGDNLK